MKNKLLIFLAGTFIISSAAFAAVACSDGADVGAVYHAELNLTADGEGTKISWEPINGVEFYVLRAPSRFGEFVPVAQNLTDGEYSDDTRFNYYRAVAYDKKSGDTLRTFDTLSEEQELFGQNVYVFSPTDSPVHVNRVLDNIYDKQYNSEFSAERYAALFKSGQYDRTITLNQAYYTTYAGLGLSPEDVSLRSLQCVNGANTNALINFWRGTENLSFRGDVTWAVSQGAYLRRVKIDGSLSLHDRGGYASGGFLADSVITGGVNSGSQQQWFSRNCEWQSWQGNLWNMCFSGVKNTPQGLYPTYKYTITEQTPKISEKPYLVFKDGEYKIAVPEQRENSQGASWTDNGGVNYVDMQNIYFARADRDGAASINAALAAGKSVLLFAGVYKLSEPLVINRDNAVLLGTGLATLTPTNGNACLKVERGNGCAVAGILFDAGNAKSQSLADIGTEQKAAQNARLYDCFFRVGGAANGSVNVDTCLNIYADGTVCDNIWLWRADHGSGVGWTVNNGDTGLHVYGDNVTAYGLFSEHFKKNNVLWEGDNGSVTFFQSEIAYDVPNQSVWKDGDRLGYASFKVADGVTSFTAAGWAFTATSSTRAWLCKAEYKFRKGQAFL